jgi:hypothetical protein
LSSTRTYILEPVNGDRGPEAPVAELHQRLRDLVGTLMAVGGEFLVRADRVKIGELPAGSAPCTKCGSTGKRDYGQGEEDCRACGGAGRKNGRPEVISETVGFMIEWRNVPRLVEDSMTAKMMDVILDGGPPESLRQPDAEELAPEGEEE